MSGDPGYVANPAQPMGFGNAVPFVAGTPQTAGMGVLVSCTTAGTLILVTRKGQTITLNVPIGVTNLPLSCSQMNTSTFVGTAFNVY